MRSRISTRGLVCPPVDEASLGGERLASDLRWMTAISEAPSYVRSVARSVGPLQLLKNAFKTHCMASIGMVFSPSSCFLHRGIFPMGYIFSSPCISALAFSLQRL